MAHRPYEHRWALVTGASAGIGAEFARQLAAAGASLVLVGRRTDRLDALKAELAPTGVEILTLGIDLSDPAAPSDLHEELSERGIQIDILINNAGYGLPGGYAASAWADQEKFLQLMVTSYAQLVHLWFPHMKAQGWGRIINVASVAGLVPPAAGHTLYGPAKAFLVAMSQSLAAEGTPHGVHVSAMCPGFTLTEFHDVNNTREQISALPNWMVMRVEPSVHGALRAADRNKTVYVPGLVYKFIVWLSGALPRSWAEDIVAGSGDKYRDAS